MSRRRVCWLFAGLLLLGGVAVACYVFATRDNDIYVIGKKTHGVRASLAMLDSTVDRADFRDCKTVQEALNRLYAKLKEGERGRALDKDAVEQWIWIDRRVIYVDEDAFGEAGEMKVRDRPIRLPAESETMTVKQILRTIFQQANVPETRLIVRWNQIEATTAKRAEEERRRYLDSVSLFDRMRDWWKEINGEVESDPVLLNL